MVGTLCKKKVSCFRGESSYKICIAPYATLEHMQAVGTHYWQTRMQLRPLVLSQVPERLWDSGAARGSGEPENCRRWRLRWRLRGGGQTWLAERLHMTTIISTLALSAASTSAPPPPNAHTHRAGPIRRASGAGEPLR